MPLLPKPHFDTPYWPQSPALYLSGALVTGSRSAEDAGAIIQAMAQALRQLSSPSAPRVPARLLFNGHLGRTLVLVWN